MKSINLNDIVKVKLTDYGKNIYYHKYDRLIELGYRFVPVFPIEDKNGFIEFQLWDFIQMYGPHIGMGLPDVVSDLNLYIEEE
jgi:hypothetical protein